VWRRADKAALIWRKEFQIGMATFELSPYQASAMVIERLSQEHRNIRTLLAILERELEIFDVGESPDYEVIRSIISYFEIYTEIYHHPQEDLVFAKLKIRDPAAAKRIGNLAREHRVGTDRLRKVAEVIDLVLSDEEILREKVDAIVREFIMHERRHLTMEDQEFFPAALKALKPQDWDDIAAAVDRHRDPLFSDVVEDRFGQVREYILRLEEDAEVERAARSPRSS
jgi:hemerythrin-like domain-containing protein